MAEVRENERLKYHLQAVLKSERRFENVNQAVTRMVLADGVDKVSIAGRTTYDFRFFRKGPKHIIGWLDEINDFVNFTKDAAEGGPSKEMAFVLVGEPGNGKTFFVDYICDRYKRFTSLPENRRYTFEFANLDQLGGYGGIRFAQSQTFEDPVILAMNLFESVDENKEYLLKFGFGEQRIEQLFGNYRPLGACTEHIWNEIFVHYDGDVEKALGSVKIVPAKIGNKKSGVLTGKYSAKDKITSSAEDILGDEDLKRMLDIEDAAHPYRYNVRRGVIARVAGGGILFLDEFFRIKKDLVQVFLQVIQDRIIELRGFCWYPDMLIIGTSNSDSYKDFVAEKSESPIKDRSRVCYVSHCTDYKLQQLLTRYSLGVEKKSTVIGEEMHEDPNLNYALSVAVTLTRLPHSDQLTPVETMKLEAGEIAGDKSVKTLTEIKGTLNASTDVTKRWGQRGVGHRGLGRFINIMLAMPETHEGKCLFAYDCFKAAEREVIDFGYDPADREKFMKDIAIARKLYRERIKTGIYNAFRDDPEAVRKDVMIYVNMIIGFDSDALGPDKIWRPKDPQTGEEKPLKIDEKYINSVESRLGLNTKETRDSFRTSIRRIYGQKATIDPDYDFMDNERLIKAVTEVRLESDFAGAGSLIGALSNPTNEENARLRNRMIDTMFKMGYCRTCAQKTIEYWCEKEDEE
ncbi:MAG: serine protein kinase PrkA [Candidatus Niyogibacteria bacterium]|nr:MAG: serine protein kinase PrkA [Candidatus Niyogibacteria bacterium]